MEMQNIYLLIVYSIGVAARVVLPYVQSRLLADGPLTFDWRYLVGQLIGAFTGIIVLFLTADFWGILSKYVSSSEQIGPYAMYLAVFCVGWFATDAGRYVDKGVTARKSG